MGRRCVVFSSSRTCNLAPPASPPHVRASARASRSIAWSDRYGAYVRAVSFYWKFCRNTSILAAGWLRGDRKRVSVALSPRVFTHRTHPRACSGRFLAPWRSFFSGFLTLTGSCVSKARLSVGVSVSCA